ncbi:MAG: pyridoxamine 5'-phosphate oxidase family protein [Ferruginibacter sp.]
MTKEFLFDFIRQHKFGVLSTVSPGNVPESAYVGIAVTQDLKIIFDTLSDTRKYKNILLNPNISFVIGWDNEKTVQYEGTAKIPETDERNKLLQTYFEIFPEKNVINTDWKTIAYFCVEPKWIRYSDFSEETRQIKEINL